MSDVSDSQSDDVVPAPQRSPGFLKKNLKIKDRKHPRFKTITGRIVSVWCIPNQCDQMLGVKRSPIYLQNMPKKYPHQFNIKSAIFHESPKLSLNIWATFERNFAPNTFQKSSNLVTLFPTVVVRYFSIKVNSHGHFPQTRANFRMPD